MSMCSDEYLYGRESFVAEREAVAYFYDKLRAARSLLEELLSVEISERDNLRINRVSKAYRRDREKRVLRGRSMRGVEMKTRAKELEEFARDIECVIDEAMEWGKEMFLKNDGGKAPLAILFDTSSALAGVANAMAYGAKKYDRKNWRKVDDAERYVSAALRHISAYCSGELVDDESGMHHLDHAICSLLFLSELTKEGGDENGK